jgi:hypothetical protein
MAWSWREPRLRLILMRTSEGRDRSGATGENAPRKLPGTTCIPRILRGIGPLIPHRLWRIHGTLDSDAAGRGGGVSRARGSGCCFAWLLIGPEPEWLLFYSGNHCSAVFKLGIIIKSPRLILLLRTS